MEKDVYFTIIMNNYTKKSRQKYLKEIIEQTSRGDQNHLLNELKKCGIQTTQATISRDLQEMGFFKIKIEPGIYKYKKYETPSKGDVQKHLCVMFQSFVLDIKSVQNMILVKTSPGNANGLASLIDSEKYGEILGTIAGDDTILIIIDTIKNRKKIEIEFQKFQT